MKEIINKLKEKDIKFDKRYVIILLLVIVGGIATYTGLNYLNSNKDNNDQYISTIGIGNKSNSALINQTKTVSKRVKQVETRTNNINSKVDPLKVKNKGSISGITKNSNSKAIAEDSDILKLISERVDNDVYNKKEPLSAEELYKLKRIKQELEIKKEIEKIITDIQQEKNKRNRLKLFSMIPEPNTGSSLNDSTTISPFLPDKNTPDLRSKKEKKSTDELLDLSFNKSISELRILAVLPGLNKVIFRDINGEIIEASEGNIIKDGIEVTRIGTNFVELKRGNKKERMYIN